MFNKKEEFHHGLRLSQLTISTLGGGLVADMAQYIVYCHAEIERRDAELDLVLNTRFVEIVEVNPRHLQPSDAKEREWISSETHPTFPVAGYWFYRGRLSGKYDCRFKNTDDRPSRHGDYTLILAEKDFPKPPEKPFEVKVGKYHSKYVTDLEVISVARGYVTYLIGDESFVNTTNDFIDVMKNDDAFLIEEATDAE